MAEKNKQAVGIVAGSMDAVQGYDFVRAKEEDRAVKSEQRFGTFIDHYEIAESSKGYEITVIVHVPRADTGRKAEWAGFLTVKNRHPSLYAESKMALQTQDGWLVYVRWMLWKPSDEAPAIPF